MGENCLRIPKKVDILTAKLIGEFYTIKNTKKIQNTPLKIGTHNIRGLIEYINIVIFGMGGGRTI